MGAFEKLDVNIDRLHDFLFNHALCFQPQTIHQPTNFRI
jgi:hypothetical protein